MDGLRTGKRRLRVVQHALIRSGGCKRVFLEPAGTDGGPRRRVGPPLEFACPLGGAFPLAFRCRTRCLSRRQQGVIASAREYRTCATLVARMMRPDRAADAA